MITILDSITFFIVLPFSIVFRQPATDSVKWSHRNTVAIGSTIVAIG